MALLVVEYLQWQYGQAPRWLAVFLLNVERALLRFFSVGFLLKTLFSYWHRDRVSLRQGSFSGMLIALAWNGISRGIGFIIRSLVLTVWLIVQVLYVGVAVLTMLLFLLWPWLSVAAVLWGLFMILAA